MQPPVDTPTISNQFREGKPDRLIGTGLTQPTCKIKHHVP
jgi:hypothetical protein